MFIGGKRGERFGDMWGFNIGIAKVKQADKTSLVYQLNKSEFLIRDLVTQGFLAKSKPPVVSTATVKKVSTATVNQKQHLSAPDMRRQNRTKLDFVLNAGERWVEVEEKGVGEVENEGDLKGGEDIDMEGLHTVSTPSTTTTLGSGGIFNAVNEDHAEQVTQRRILNRFSTVSSWIRIQCISSSKFQGVFLKGALSLEPASSWGLIGRVTPRCKSSWLRVQNLHPAMQKRVKFNSESDDKKKTAEKIISWCLIAAFMSFRVDQDALQQFADRPDIAKSAGNMHTCVFLDPSPVLAEVDDEWQRFCDILFELVPGETAKEEAAVAKDALGFCVEAAVDWEEEEKQWRVMEGKVEDVLNELDELEGGQEEGGTEEDVEMEE